jgi:hypothetical protein
VAQFTVAISREAIVVEVQDRSDPLFEQLLVDAVINHVVNPLIDDVPRLTVQEDKRKPTMRKLDSAYVLDRPESPGEHAGSP